MTDASRVLLIGDSLAVGLGPPLRELAGAAGLELVVEAQQSTRIDQWAGERLRGLLATFQPGLTLVSLGTNDMRQRAAREAKRGQIGELVDTVRRGGGDLAWIGPPSMPFPDAGIRALLWEELNARSVPFFDSSARTIERAHDRIHATATGYQRWAEQIAAWVPFAVPAEAASPEDDPADAEGDDAPVTVTWDPPSVAWIPGGILALTLLGLGLAATRARHARPTTSDPRVLVREARTR